VSREDAAERPNRAGTAERRRASVHTTGNEGTSAATSASELVRMERARRLDASAVVATRV
jgi:hypothetical protein